MNSIISYHKLVGIEKQNLQHGMNYRCSEGHSVFLMSTRSSAPYDDEIAADGRILIYEGHEFIGHNFVGKYLDCGTMDGYIKSSLKISKI